MMLGMYLESNWWWEEKIIILVEVDVGNLRRVVVSADKNFEALLCS